MSTDDPPDSRAADDQELTTRSLPDTDSEAQVLGRYRLHEQIGSGGMGEVYRAEQTQPVQRIVAVKIIKRGMDSEHVIARFEAERQALALMDHSNIAKVFDAGTTPSGRPYFVMEYVKGVPITTFCDKRKLTTTERLALFMQVCDGVQHAHQKAIIHRDLKPSNVLVTIQDDKPVPKIIDFGVAKAIAQKLSENTVYTALGELIGTPEYMSPEQAEMTGENVDTRTDVYSLGVLLYELLAGGLPLEPEALRAHGFQGIVQMIREHDPPRPSNKLNTLGGRSKEVATARRTLPAKLRHQLRGDLDKITMKALEKDPARRYASAAELAADVQRHLHHEPVLACPPGVGYLLKKFVRRHRVGVAAGSVVVASLLAGVVVSVRFALSEAHQRRIAATQRDTAEAVNEFLNNDLLSAVAPSADKGKGKDALMRDVLDEAAKRIEEASAAGGKFAGKPIVEASIRQTIGNTYLSLGELSVAEPHLKRALELRRAELGEEHAETLSSMRRLAILYAERGRYEEAEPLFLKLLEIQRRVFGEEHPRTLTYRNGLAVLYQRQGRYDEAEPLYRKTIEVQERVLGKEHPGTLTCTNNLALLYLRQGRYEEAEPLFLRTLELQKRVVGPEHPNTLTFTKNLALLYSKQERYDEAERLYLNTLEIQKRIVGEEHPEALNSLHSLANLYARQGRYDEAAVLYLKTMELRKQVLGEEHPDTVGTIVSYCVLLIERKQFEQAEAMLVDSHRVLCDVLGPNRPQTIASIEALVALYNAWEKPQRATEWRSKLGADQQAS